MIAGIFHDGSGLGDQLFRYITTRTLAEDKGYDWGMLNLSNFKGISFIRASMGTPLPFSDVLPLEHFQEHETRENREGEWVDVRSYDPEINFVTDGTLIDGSFEDDKYWRHKLPKISKWLEVEPLEVPVDLCVIGFRGGEYARFPDLFLPKEYYDQAIAKMRAIDPNMRFQVHTDDPDLAARFFPEFEIVDNTAISHSLHTNIGFNWRSTRFAKYAIIPNSAFFILPRLLKHQEDATSVTLAPRYWARHNKKIWARPACFYHEFTYL